MITRNAKQYELITNGSSDYLSQIASGKAAAAIRRRMLAQTDELWITRTDVMILNRVAQILRLGTYKDPFAGGAAFNVTKMVVTPTVLKYWMAG